MQANDAEGRKDDRLRKEKRRRVSRCGAARHGSGIHTLND